MKYYVESYLSYLYKKVIVSRAGHDNFINVYWEFYINKFVSDEEWDICQSLKAPRGVDHKICQEPLLYWFRRRWCQATQDNILWYTATNHMICSCFIQMQIQGAWTIIVKWIARECCLVSRFVGLGRFFERCCVILHTLVGLQQPKPLPSWVSKQDSCLLYYPHFGRQSAA